MSDMPGEIISRLPLRKYPKQTSKPDRLYEDSKLGSVYRLPIFVTNVAINDSSFNKKKQDVGYMSFEESWFNGQSLNPEYCFIIQILDHSMEPTIASHSIVLVDLSRYRRRQGHIYAIRIGDNLIVRRLAKSEDKWQLIGDHPELKPEPLPNSAEIIGELRWMAKTLG